MGLLIAWFTLLMLPGHPNPTGPCLDCGWMYGLNLAHAESLVFGRDIMFTYGPWGRFIYPTFPQTDLYLHLAVLTSLTLLYSLGLVMVSWRVRDSRRALAVVLLVQTIALIAYRGHVESVELIVLTLGLAVMAADDTWPWLELIVMSLISSVGLVMKTNQFVLGFAITALMIAWTMWRRRAKWATSLRNGAICFALLIGAVPVIFQLATGDVTALPGYLHGTVELMKGYSESMSVQGPFSIYTLGVMAVLTLFLLIPIISEEKWGLWPALPPAAVLTFIAFRHAMTRQDGHAMPFLARLAFAGLFIFVIARTSRTRTIVAAFCLLASFQSAAFFFEDNVAYWIELRDRFTMRRFSETVRDVIHRDEKEREYRLVSMEVLKKSQSLTPAQMALVKGHTAECVPFDTYLPYANGLVWNPRPIFQTYSAYTPYLDQWNARHLRERGAERIIIHAGAIDNRLQQWEDPASTLAMIDGYDVLDYSDEHVILGRRAAPRLGNARVVGARQIAWNEAVTPPPSTPNQLRLLKLVVTPSLIGKLMGFITRTPAVNMRITLSNGRVAVHRAVFPNLSEGIAIDAVPEGLNQIVSLFDGPSAGLHASVRSIALETPSPLAFQPTIHAEWLTVERHDSMVARVTSPARPLWKPGQPLDSSGGLVTSTATVMTWQATSSYVQLFVPLPAASMTTLRLRVRHTAPREIAFSIGKQRWQEDLPVANQWTDVYVQIDQKAEPAARLLQVAVASHEGDTIELGSIDVVDGPPPNPHRAIFMEPTPLP